MHPRARSWLGIDLIWQYCEGDIPQRTCPNGENIYFGDGGFRALLVRRLSPETRGE
jgi:hypothetical protein